MLHNLSAQNMKVRSMLIMQFNINSTIAITDAEVYIALTTMVL